MCYIIIYIGYEILNIRSIYVVESGQIHEMLMTRDDGIVLFFKSSHMTDGDIYIH